VLNPTKLAAGMLVFAEVRLQHSGLRFADEFKAAVMTRAEILECHEITGAFDYLIKARVADMLAYRELVSSVVWSLPSVRDIRTFVVLEEIKSTASGGISKHRRRGLRPVHRRAVDGDSRSAIAS